MSGSLDQMIRTAISSKTTERAPKEAPRARPQVSLLPAEVRGTAQVRKVRLALGAGVLAVAVATAGVVVAAGGVAADADARSADASSRLATSSAQLAKFKDVQTLQQRIALEKAAVQVGTSTAIDWQARIGELLADMPAGFTVTSIAADGATPFLDYPQGTSPLDKPRAATVKISAKTASILELPVWLRKLKSVPSYGDAVPTVSNDGDSGYTVQVEVHLTSAALTTPPKGTK